MRRRLRKKRLAGLYRLIGDGLHLYSVPPHSGPDAEPLSDLSLELLSLDIGIALALLTQWFPPARRGAWISDTGKPVIRQESPAEFRLSGTLIFKSTANDQELGRGEYVLSASKLRDAWRVHALNVRGPQDYVSPALRP